VQQQVGDRLVRTATSSDPANASDPRRGGEPPHGWTRDSEQIPQAPFRSRPPRPDVGIREPDDAEVQRPHLVLASLLLPQHSFRGAPTPWVGVLDPAVELDRDGGRLEPGVDDAHEAPAVTDLHVELGCG
jgi:hypothetical protein